MKAILCAELGPPEALVFGDVPDPDPAPGQVVIDVEAAGVNFPDSLMIQGRYQFQPPLPFTPGGELAGTVFAVGDGVDTVSPGDRVAAFTLWGAFAERVAVDASAVMPIPDSMPVEVAAGFAIAYGTAYHALKDRAVARPGESLLVLGAAGGTGLAAVELGKAMDLKVIAAASSEQKLDVCRLHGADDTIDYSTEDLKERAKSLSGGGVDIVFDPVGGDLTEQALRATGWQGRLLVIGFAAGPIPSIPLNLPLLKGCDIRGVFWGSFVAHSPEASASNMAELIELYQSGRIDPLISARYPLDEAGSAIRLLMDRQATGKVILEV